jgi:hypothetical protein
VGVGVAQPQPQISYCPACFGYFMKVKSVERTALISKNFELKIFGFIL